MAAAAEVEHQVGGGDHRSDRRGRAPGRRAGIERHVGELAAAIASGGLASIALSLGFGAMSAAGGQLGFLLLDDQLVKSPDTAEKKPEPAASKPAAPAAPAGKRQAGDIPADALARAYDRARLRMALTSDGTN